MIDFLWNVISILFASLIIITLVVAIGAVIGLTALAVRIFWEDWREDGK